MSPYDFIVIGGGTAGLVVANRLSESVEVNVLVLEAGADYSSDARVRTPGFYPILAGSEVDWAFQSENQPSLNGRRIDLPQGKALGGSSAINAHVFVPPSKSLVDSWGQLGNQDWNWDILQPYFAKAYTSPSTKGLSAKVLGTEGWTSRNEQAKGPIKASFSGNTSHPIREAWADAFKSSSLYANDPYMKISVGGFSALASIDPDKKERSYAASAYYQPVKDRGNLHVLLNATVEKILFDTAASPPKAIGVLYRHDGELKKVLSTKEVILAAGALQSPKVLELSGVGSRDLLQSHGIEVIADLPAVGENLHDHPLCSIPFYAKDDLDTLDALVRQEPEAMAKAMAEYAANQTGLLNSVGVNTYAYLPILEGNQDSIRKLLDENAPPQGDDPEQVRARAYHAIAEKTLLNRREPSGAYLSVLAQHLVPPPSKSLLPAGPIPGKFLSIGLMLSQPLSRGSVHIQSADILRAPLINPNYLLHPVDMEVMAHHMLYIEKIVQKAPIGKLLQSPLKYRDPATQLSDLDSAKDYLRSSVISMWHLAGSCAMLPKEKGGVVDSKLKVYGVSNLRIVDASAIPLVSTANIQATVYTFAERAADLIKKDYMFK